MHVSSKKKKKVANYLFSLMCMCMYVCVFNQSSLSKINFVKCLLQILSTKRQLNLTKILLYSMMSMQIGSRHTTKSADITWEQIVGKNQSAMLDKKLTARTNQKQNRILSFTRFLLPIYVHKLY